MEVPRLLGAVVLVCAIFLTAGEGNSIPGGPNWPPVTTCQDHAWFSLVPVDKAVLAGALPDDVTLGPLPLSYKGVFPPNTHPVLWEFGRQVNCQVG